jgi:hypothetical protein
MAASLNERPIFGKAWLIFGMAIKNLANHAPRHSKAITKMRSATVFSSKSTLRIATMAKVTEEL